MTLMSKELEQLLLQIKEDISGFKVIKKVGLFWDVLSAVVRIVTFNTNKDFKNGHVITLGPYVCVPNDWDKLTSITKYGILKHEYMHLKQTKRVGFGSFWLGLPIFWLSYALLPLPIGFAYCRYLYEREAYFEGVKLYYSLYKDNKDATIEINEAVEQLTRGYYGFTWPFPKQVRKYFEKRFIEYKNEIGATTRDNPSS